MDIFVFIDALGWDVVERTDFLSRELPFRRGASMQFGYSCSAIPTILSGKRPAEHGHLGLFEFAPARSPFRRVAAFMKILRPRSFWERGRVRGWLSRAVKKVLGFTGYFQLYRMPAWKLAYMDYCEKRDLFVPGGMEGVENIADVLARSGLSWHVSDWRLPDEANFERAAQAVAGGADFTFVYTAELDALRHDNATEAGWENVRRKIDWYAGKIRALAAAAAAKARETGGEWSLTVFSDHGMTPLTKTIDLMSAVEATGLEFGVDYGACFDSTLFRVHYLKDGAREKIEAAIAPFASDGRWLAPDEEKKHGIWREDRAFGDAIFLVNPGVQIVPSDMGAKPLGGMHGFDPDDFHSKAAVMSTRPLPDWLRGVGDYFRLMKESAGRLCARKEGTLA